HLQAICSYVDMIAHRRQGPKPGGADALAAAFTRARPRRQAPSRTAGAAKREPHRIGVRLRLGTSNLVAFVQFLQELPCDHERATSLAGIRAAPVMLVAVVRGF